MGEKKIVSGGVAAMREQIKEAIAAAEVEVKTARSRAHVGAAYAAGKIAAYEHALAVMHS
jgi:hypothetical protein